METAQRLKLWQGVIFIVVWTTYGSAYLLRKPIGVVKDNLQKALDISAVNLGWLDVALLFPYAGVSLMLGSVGDRLGPRRTLGVGIIIASIATGSITACESYPTLLGLLAVSGAAQALCWPASCTILGRWFSDATRNTVFGGFGTCCFVFGMIGTAITVYIRSYYGWRVVFLPPSIFAAVMGMLLLQVGQDPEERSLVVSGRTTVPVGTKKEDGLSMLTVWKLPLVPEISLAMFCIKSVRYALMFWLPLYLRRSLTYSEAGAGMASTAFEVGGIFGSVFVGAAVDRYMKGKAILTCTLAIFASAMSLLGFVILASCGPVCHFTFLVLAGAFNCGPDILLAGSVATEVGERMGGAAAVSGVVNGMGSLGTVLEGPLVAIVAANLGWEAVMPLMVILSALGAIAVFKASIKEHKLRWVKASSIDGSNV